MAGVIDCDIHNAPRSEAALLEYMPAQWRERRVGGGRLETSVEARRETLGDRSYLGGEYPRATPRAARTDEQQRVDDECERDGGGRDLDARDRAAIGGGNRQGDGQADHSSD